MLQVFSEGLAMLCNERFKALLAEPRGTELLDPDLQTTGLILGPPAALQIKPASGKPTLDTSDNNTSAAGDEVVDVG